MDVKNAEHKDNLKPPSAKANATDTEDTREKIFHPQGLGLMVSAQNQCDFNFILLESRIRNLIIHTCINIGNIRTRV
jgi:hypothetical protein